MAKGFVKKFMDAHYVSVSAKSDIVLSIKALEERITALEKKSSDYLTQSDFMDDSEEEVIPVANQPLTEEEQLSVEIEKEVDTLVDVLENSKLSDAQKQEILEILTEDFENDKISQEEFEQELQKYEIVIG